MLVILVIRAGNSERIAIKQVFLSPASSRFKIKLMQFGFDCGLQKMKEIKLDSFSNGVLLASITKNSFWIADDILFVRFAFIIHCLLEFNDQGYEKRSPES